MVLYRAVASRRSQTSLSANVTPMRRSEDATPRGAIRSALTAAILRPVLRFFVCSRILARKGTMVSEARAPTPLRVGPVTARFLMIGVIAVLGWSSCGSPGFLVSYELVRHNEYTFKVSVDTNGWVETTRWSRLSRPWTTKGRVEPDRIARLSALLVPAEPALSEYSDFWYRMLHAPGDFYLTLSTRRHFIKITAEAVPGSLKSILRELDSLSGYSLNPLFLD